MRFGAHWGGEGWGHTVVATSVIFVTKKRELELLAVVFRELELEL